MGYGIDHSCQGEWYDKRKNILDTYYTVCGAITYSFRVSAGGLSTDNYVEQMVLAHLKGAQGAFPLMQDRRPPNFD